MTKIYEMLTDQEEAALIDAIPVITLYIGAADGQLDIQESAWAHRVTEIRAFEHNNHLKEYYQAVSRTFDERLNNYLRRLSGDAEEREADLVQRLEALNPILSKIPQDEAHHLYRDFLSFAGHVAKSSGGFLYMGNVSPEEKKRIELEMIQPIGEHNI